MDIFRTYASLVAEYRYEYAKLKEKLRDPGPDLEELFEIHLQQLMVDGLPEGKRELQITQSRYRENDSIFLLPYLHVPKWYKRFAKKKGLRIRSADIPVGYETSERIYFLTF